jgi:hypothetical protein
LSALYVAQIVRCDPTASGSFLNGEAALLAQLPKDGTERGIGIVASHARRYRPAAPASTNYQGGSNGGNALVPKQLTLYDYTNYQGGAGYCGRFSSAWANSFHVDGRPARTRPTTRMVGFRCPRSTSPR